MNSAKLFAVVVILMGLALVSPRTSRADEIPEKYRTTINKGLDWLASKQTANGSFSANGDQYQVPMTALAGIAFLM